MNAKRDRGKFCELRREAVTLGLSAGDAVWRMRARVGGAAIGLRLGLLGACVDWWALVCGALVLGQGVREELRLLAEPQRRQAVIGRMADRAQAYLPVLIELGNRPPSDVDPQEFAVGLAMAFGRLRAPEGIPFLIRNLTLQRGLYFAVLHKNRLTILAKYPAMGALIEIGPRSLLPIGERLAVSSNDEERTVAIMVAGSIGGPEAVRLLTEVRARSDRERRLIARELGALQ